jgi:hypothetical protein
MSAAEVPSAGHETAPNCGWLEVADPAAGVAVPEGDAVGQETDVGLGGDLCRFAMARLARQPSAVRQASAVSSVRFALRRR